METGKMRSSVSMVLLMLMSIFAAMDIPEAEASEVVLTDAIQIVNGGSANDRMVATDADSMGNVHFVWSRNTQHLWYQMHDPRGEVLIAETQLSNPGAHRAWHPDIAVDSEDKVHITWTDKASQWTIQYTLVDPSQDDQNGDSAIDNVISLIDDFEVSVHTQNRDWPAIDTDSENNAHIVWEDSFEPLEKFYQQPQIYYSMIQPDLVSREALVAIDETLLTPIIGHKGHPDIAVDLDDFVQIVWDDTRGGKVEMVAPIDTSGSMNAEWADMCVVFYGGYFVSGGYFEGLKPMLLEANMTVYETLYALSGNWPGAATSGNCAAAYQTGGSGSQGPRNTPLGIASGDDSGGIRYLTEVVYNNGAVNLPQDGGYYSEFWGPASTWACLSWKDSAGGVPGNPPTQLDHKWNPNATKIIIPISDEGPYGGDPSQQSDDTQSINEAHDACVEAGIIPVPLLAAGFGSGSQDVGSHMMDLAQCPNGFVSLNTRTCPGSSLRLTDAEGQMYSFPTSSSSSAELQLMVEAMVYLSTNNSREIYMTILDPLSLVENPSPGWQFGDSGTYITGNTYTEDLGPSIDGLGYGHLVVVNDTRLTLNDAYSLHPAIAVDNSGNTHVAWMDGRAYGFDIDVNYEIYYSRLRLRGAGEWNGAPNGLPSYGIKQIVDSAISDVEGLESVSPDRPFAPNSHMPSIFTDSFDNVHLAWLDNYNETQGETLVYTRLNHTTDDYPNGFPLNSLASGILEPWEIVPITEWQSDKLGPNSPAVPDLGQPPAFANDLGSGAHVAWSDTNKCNDVSNGGTYTLCYVHVLTGLVDVSLTETETYYHTIEPGEQTLYNLTISNPTPGPAELVSDTFTVTMEGVPNNWTATLYFTTNNTPIFDSTPVFLRGGDVVPMYMRVRAPSIYQAHADELATITVTAVSYKDPAIRDERFTVTLMDVVHGIDLDTSHYQVDVEQGESAYFSITVTNTGNVYDTFAFYDPSELEGQVEWALPFGWGLNFPLSVSLDPGQSVTRNLQVSIPTSQEPGTFVIYLKGWSTGEPVLSIDQGTFDVLELWINVSIKSTGNIVFNMGEQTKHVLPGDCSEFEIAVTKHFTPGYLIFTTPGGPEERPPEISEETWRLDHWTVDLDFEGAPGGNAVPDNAPRYWSLVDTPINVTAIMCAPYNATAGLGESVTVKAHLEGATRVRDSVVLLTNVIQRYDLEATVPETILSLYPGQTYQLDTMVDNVGNGADRYDISVNSITDSMGLSQVWDIEIPRVLFEELDRDESQTIPIHISVPEMTHAGQYTVILDVLSEEPYEGTKVRDNIILQIEIIEFHDMRIEVDPMVESKIKTTAPGRTVRFTMNITNFGNVPDQPTLHNYTQQIGASNTMVWNTAPSMSPLLTNWVVSYALLEDFDTEYPIEMPCIGQTGEDALTLGQPEPTDGCFKSASTNAITLPVMEPYTTLQVVVIIDIDPAAQLSNREIGIKVMSEYGSSVAGGDHDETEIWDDSCTLDENKDGIPDNFRPNCDTNEQIVELRLRAPDLRILDVHVERYTGDVGEMLSVNVQVVNEGNAHATDVNIILCADQTESDIEKNGCEEENIVYRQIVQAIMPSDDEDPPQIALLYMVEAGRHDVVVVIDPDNVIVETDEGNNVQRVSKKMGSNLGALDVGIEIIAQFTVPTLIVGATLALLGVVAVVMRGRREEAKLRYAEKTSMLSNLDDEDLVF
ncbi:MAG: CARDB domain-containing protein [Candidatus Thermoplasmatota archaeon]|nr:CARDB domain-containing protein [Candidatus Thermoplasmatota archaeon]